MNFKSCSYMRVRVICVQIMFVISIARTATGGLALRVELLDCVRGFGPFNYKGIWPLVEFFSLYCEERDRKKKRERKKK